MNDDILEKLIKLRYKIGELKDNEQAIKNIVTNPEHRELFDELESNINALKLMYPEVK